jgi:hypothetical protein
LIAGGHRALKTSVVALLATATLVLGSTAAFAQTDGYPPTTTLATCPAPVSVDLGTLGVNESATGEVGNNWIPGDTATLRLNGGSVFGNATVDSRGCVQVPVLVTNAGVALGIATFAAQALHLAASGSTVTIHGVSGLTANPPGQQNTVLVTAHTRNNITQTADGTVLFNVRPANVAGEPFARTGARIAFWTFLALALIVVGYLIVTGARRRGATR